MEKGSPLRRDLHWLVSRLKVGLHEIEERIAAAHGMSLWGYTVLVEVVSGPSRTQLALAAVVPVDKTKLVSILDELESAGLVRRRPDPRDRRARLVDPTDAGRKAYEAASAEIRAVEDDLLGDLGPAEREQFVATLQRVVLTKLADDQVPSGRACP